MKEYWDTRGTQQALRREIEACERLEAHFREKLLRIKKVGYYWLEDETAAAIHHYMGRRNYFIRRLTETQLKEFDRG